VKRLEILADLARIPSKFDLPICVGATDRKWAPTALDRPISTAALEQVVHAHSFYKFVMQVEVIMRATASDEVAMLIAEDRPIVRKMLKFAHAALRGRAPSWAKTDLESAKAEDPLMRLLVPLERIVETVHFAEKTESSLLQIADVCAFICKRNLMKASHADDLYEHVKRQVVFAPEVMAALRASSETAS
jgi:hypothetical protein